MAFSNSRRNGTAGYNDYGSASSGKSFFGQTMKIDGEITSDEDLTVEGQVTGKLEISKTLTIGNNGHVDGEISAAVIRISGKAEGQLVATEKLEIESNGNYSGNIQAERIVIAEGAKMKGTVNVSDGPMSKPIEKITQDPEPEQEETTIEETVDEEIVEGEIIEEQEEEEKEEEAKEDPNTQSTADENEVEPADDSAEEETAEEEEKEKSYPGKKRK